jgi:hypothetical protein
MILLGLNELSELCYDVHAKLAKCGIKSDAILTISVDKNSLRKIDEDLFYRQNDKDKEFIPSENEVNVIFENITVKIKATEQS